MYFRVSGVLSNRGLTDGIPQAAERRTQPATGPHYVGKGQVRSFGTAIPRVRSLGYTGRELDMAGTSVVSHKQTQAAPQRQTNLWRIAMPVAGAAAPPQPDSKPSLGWSRVYKSMK